MARRPISRLGLVLLLAFAAISAQKLPVSGHDCRCSSAGSMGSTQAIPFQQVAVDQKYADRKWEKLERAIHEIYNHNASGLNFEELYRFSLSLFLSLSLEVHLAFD